MEQATSADRIKYPKALRAVRRVEEIHLEDLTAALGISTSALCRYEKGARRPPRQTVEKLAAALGVPVAVLIEEERTHA